MIDPNHKWHEVIFFKKYKVMKGNIYLLLLLSVLIG